MECAWSVGGGCAHNGSVAGRHEIGAAASGRGIKRARSVDLALQELQSRDYGFGFFSALAAATLGAFSTLAGAALVAILAVAVLAVALGAAAFAGAFSVFAGVLTGVLAAACAFGALATF